MGRPHSPFVLEGVSPFFFPPVFVASDFVRSGFARGGFAVFVPLRFRGFGFSGEPVLLGVIVAC